MATFFEIQKATLKRMHQVATLAKQLGFESIADLIAEKMEEMVQRQLVVVVAGEVKRGKSALLNAILNEKNQVCPVDADVCTNAVTIVRYGKEERIQVSILDKDTEDGIRVETITRDEIADYVSESNNPGNYKNVVRIEVELNNDLLKEGVVFVDTPGLGSLNEEHAEITYGFLPNADMLLFVTDTASVVSSTELSFLERGYSYCDCVVFPLTKMDLNAEYEVLLESNKKKISQALQIPVEEVQMIPVNSKAKQRYLKKPEREDYYRNSNYPELEKAIWTTIARRQAEIRILPYLNDVENHLRMMMDTLVGQYKVLGDGKASGDLAQGLREKAAEIEKLRQDGAEWKLNLQIYFSNLQMDISNTRDRISRESRAILDDTIAKKQTKICKKKNIEKLVTDVNNKMILGTIEIRKMMEEGVDDQIKAIQKSLGLNVTSNESILDKMDFNPDTDVTVNFPKKKAGAKMLNKGRKIGGSTFGGSSLGTVVGGALGASAGAVSGFLAAGPAGAYVGAIEGGKIGAAAGATAGAALGGGAGVIKSFEKYEAEDIGAVRNALNQHINTSVTYLSNTMNNTCRTLQTVVSSSFDTQLKLQLKMLQENLKGIQDNLGVDTQDIPKKKKELTEKIEKTKLLLDKMINLQDKIESLQVEMVEETVKEEIVEYGFM